MPVMRLFHKVIKEKLPFINKARVRNIFIAVTALITGSKLSLTGLGRHILSSSTMRSQIKKIDRLIGNRHLYKERLNFYRVLSSMGIPSYSSPWIQVDWTCVCSITNLYILRASLSAQGRSVVVYEEVHPKKYENNHKIHKAFLSKLKSILPLNVKPVIITDAGFRAPWFQAVVALGWDFVGRLRNKNLVQLTSCLNWQLSSSLYAKAKNIPTYLGTGLLTRKGRVFCSFVIYKGKSKSRRRLNNDGSKCNHSKSKRYAKSYREPWLLVTSIKQTFQIANVVLNPVKGWLSYCLLLPLPPLFVGWLD